MNSTVQNGYLILLVLSLPFYVYILQRGQPNAHHRQSHIAHKIGGTTTTMTTIRTKQAEKKREREHQMKNKNQNV